MSGWTVNEDDERRSMVWLDEIGLCARMKKNLDHTVAWSSV